MALVALPPELRSICRRLTSVQAQQLPALLPVLLKDVLRCQEPLSQPQDNSAEATALVHQLKTHITTLLNGRVAQGRFVGVVLVKAVVQVGGWECLQTAGPWIQGILAILQKKEPVVTKELCLVTLTRIFNLIHGYPTLVREIVTPRLPGFVTTCLQILKPPVSSKVARAPYSLKESIFESLSTLVPLYPTTMRQFSGKLKAELRPFLVPTTTDNVLIPTSLRESSRRLTVRLHMTAPKGGDSTEWVKHVEELTKACHTTADQVFRAVQESWESSIGYRPVPANFDAEPQGGSEKPEQLPLWVGVQAGSERLIGLLDFISVYLRCRTKAPVTIPISAIVDISARISSIKPPVPGKEKQYSAQMHPAAGREERDNLWAAFPDIQIAVMRMLRVTIQRLQQNYIPVAQETLDQTLQIFASGYHLPEIRSAVFLLVEELLNLSGPTMARTNVEGLGLVIKSCCRDILGAAGHLRRPKQQIPPTQNGYKPKSGSQNADGLLSNKIEDDVVSVNVNAAHLSAAEALLTALFSHIPQHFLPSSLRAQMLKTAILSCNKAAQVASVLHPSRDRSGRTPQVILPYLTRQFPHDKTVEILRFNFRPMATLRSSDFMEVENAIEIEDNNEEVMRDTDHIFSFDQPMEDASTDTAINTQDAIGQVQVLSPPPIRAQPASAQILPRSSGVAITSEETATVKSHSPPQTLPLKRKSENAAADVIASKRIEIDTTASHLPNKREASPLRVSTMATSQASKSSSHAAVLLAGQDAEDESDNESVHLNMELDTDSGEDDDDGRE
ncbi:rRNA processing/ribosome biogenesis-domain-containing protein [Xylariaceae sp. FL0016]|nr:rRNA processing/ribosome biogenesis-domain-containing protein [Xylariaceae sp. FL0016]